MMDRKKAADLLDNLIGMVEDNHGEDYDTALKMGIEALSTSGDGPEPVDDTISRQAAIDALGGNVIVTSRESAKAVMDYIRECADRIRSLPSAQPEKRTEERTETHACDCIDRQAAIDAIVAWTVEDRPDIEMPTDLVGRINALPPAQPELIAQGAYVRGFEQGKTQGMVDAKLQPTCNKLATDCISRQAAIDAARDRMGKGETHIGDTFIECFEMILKALPSAQPEIIRCRNCKFASGDSRICMKFGHSPIGELDFCAWAERRTDEQTKD